MSSRRAEVADDVAIGGPEVISARLVLGPAATTVLAAAVLGRRCTFERLCQVADLNEGESLEALETLLDNRLLAEQPSDWRPYTLAHDYIREVVYSESREARRRVFHRRALLALEADRAPAAECAAELKMTAPASSSSPHRANK